MANWHFSFPKTVSGDRAFESCFKYYQNNFAIRIIILIKFK